MLDLKHWHIPSKDIQKRKEIWFARGLRLAVVQNQYDDENLTEEEARDLLCSPLTPGDDSTFYDDSDQLQTPRVRFCCACPECGDCDPGKCGKFAAWVEEHKETKDHVDNSSKKVYNEVNK